jgi:hypothetical protein
MSFLRLIRKLIARVALIIFALILVALFYRVPQWLLSLAFPNDYVYRSTVSVTYQGKKYTGETLTGCREIRNGWPDWINIIRRLPYSSRVWSTALNIELPDRRFLLLPGASVCGQTAFHKDPKWKIALGLVYEFNGVSPTSFYPLSVYSHAYLFDDAVNPKGMIAILDKNGAEELGFAFSNVTISPATWREVEDHLARKPNAPWLAPVVEKKLTEDYDVFKSGIEGYVARRYSLREAMQVPEFAAWAQTADRSQIVGPLPSGKLEQYYPKRSSVALKPDWSNHSWQVTNTSASQLRFNVFPNQWNADVKTPLVCITLNRCIKIRPDFFGSNPLIDWMNGEVFSIMRGASFEGTIIAR